MRGWFTGTRIIRTCVTAMVMRAKRPYSVIILTVIALPPNEKDIITDDA